MGIALCIGGVLPDMLSEVPDVLGRQLAQDGLGRGRVSQLDAVHQLKGIFQKGVGIIW